MKKLTPINNVALLMVLIITAAFVLTLLGIFQSCEDSSPKPESTDQYHYNIDGLKDLKKEDLINREPKDKIERP